MTSSIVMLWSGRLIREAIYTFPYQSLTLITILSNSFSPQIVCQPFEDITDHEGGVLWCCCCCYYLTATLIAPLLWGWPEEAWPKSFTNHLARSDVLLRLGEICNLAKVPTIARLLFAKGTVGSLTSTN